MKLNAILMPELIIAIVSVGVGWYLSHFSMLASEDATILNGYIDEVESCANAVEKYWLTHPSSQDDDRVLAAVVRARFSALSVLYGEAPKYMRQRDLQNYHVLQVRFFKESTGGLFEAKDRKIEPDCAIEAHRISREIIQVLRIARRDQLSPIHWFSLVGRRIGSFFRSSN